MSTSVASVVSHFPSAENGFTTTLASTIAGGATTVPLNSVAGYSNGEIAVFVVDPTDTTKKQTFTGTIDTSGVQVTNVVWTAGTNQTHTGGATVVDYATATHISMMTKGILVHADQDGTLKAGAVDASAVLADSVVSTAKIADDAVTAAKMQYGLVRQRQGGTSGDASYWTSGTNNTDTSAKALFVQVGSVGTATGSDTTVTFPVAYSFVPLVFVSVNGNNGGTGAITQNAFAEVVSKTTTTAVIRTFNTSGTQSDQNVAWLAIGQ